MNVFTFVMFAVGLVTTVLACVFIYRANANLRSAGATELTYSPAWSVGWWFVPILHLFKPYFAVKEIYLWSYANAREEADVQPRRFLLPVWWLFWVVCYFVGLISTLIYFYSSFDPSVNFLLSAVESLLYVAAGVCFIIIVSRIADWQERMESSRDTTSESAGVSSAIT